MKASELINELQAMIDKYGDKKMCIIADDFQDLEKYFEVVNGDEYNLDSFWGGKGKENDYFFIDKGC
jgi:hypothetical protein